MPNATQHLAKVKSNKSMLEKLGGYASTEFPDWFVIVSFYIALHAIEAILDQQGRRHSDNHIDRARNLEKYTSVDRDFISAYRSLYAQSLHARYMTERKYVIDPNDCKQAFENLTIIETECKNNLFDNYPDS